MLLQARNQRILGLEQLDKLYKKYQTTESELKEFHKEQDMFFRYKKDYPKYIDWIVPESLYDDASTKSRIKLKVYMMTRQQKVELKLTQQISLLD